MRIAIMGAGAVGGYFGGLLSRAGHAVTFIARGAHLAAMRERGLVLETPKGALAVDRARFVEHPLEAGACDVVLFAVKAYDIEAAAAPLKPLVDGGACVVSVLNGVDHQDRIASVLGAGSVIGGLAMVSGVIVEPGRIRYTSAMSGLRFARRTGRCPSAPPRSEMPALAQGSRPTWCPAFAQRNGPSSSGSPPMRR